MRYHFFSTLIAAFLASTLAAVTYAQSTAQITGAVTDASGAVIPGAAVTVTNEQTGIASETVSNHSGDYTVPFLQPGTYRLQAQKQGFRSFTRAGIQLQVAQGIKLDVRLELGSVSESLNVTDTAPLLDATTNAIGGVVSSDKIANLPMKGRNSNAFMLVEPGVRMPRGTMNQPVLESHFQFFSINGGRPGQNQFLLDGGNDNDVGYNGPEYTASVDAVQEYRVQTNNYSAEYANYTGGVINTVTKSGTNGFHGSLYEYVRNDVFEARDFFTNMNGTPKPLLKMNQFGGTIGGPIKRNKTFFFFGYEGLRFRIPAGGAVSGAGLPSVTSVPTALQRKGDFSQTFTSAGKLITIYDPTTTRPDPNNPGSYIRTPFEKNVIPLNQVATAVAASYPQPNTAGDPFTGLNNYKISSSEPETDDNISVRVDHRFTESLSIMGRYSESFNETRLPNVFGNVADPFNSDTFEHHASGVITLNKVFSPTMIGEFVGSWNRFTYNISSDGTGYDPTKLGLPSYLGANASVSGYPLFNIDSMSNIGHYSAAHDTWDRPEVRANLTKVSGKHTIKTGGLYGWAQLFGMKANNYTGQYGFTKAFTQGPNPLVASANAGFGFATFLLGTPTSGTYHPTSEDAADLTKYAGLYFQDDYKVTGRLTLNAGLRWDYELPRTERYNRIPNFDFTGTATLSNGTPVRGGLAFPAVKGLPRGQWNGEPRNFGPRVGFAYSLTPSTVIRGGFGIFYGNSFGSGDNANQVPNTGFGCSSAVNVSVDGGLTSAATISNPFPTGLCTPSGSNLGLLTALGQPVNVINRDHSILYTESWNFDIQQKLLKSLLFEISYSGNRGLHLPSIVSADQLNPQYLSLGTQLNSQVSNPYFGVITSGPLSGQTVARAQLLLPYPQFVNVNSVTDTYGASTYHAMYVKVERRFAGGFSILGSYTFSKLIDDVMSSPTGFFGESFAAGAPQNYYNLRGERAIASFNTPQSLVISYVYELPFGAGKHFLNQGGVVNAILGGWQVNGITMFQSGEPLQITGSSAGALNAGTLRPNWNGQNPTLSGSVTSRLGEYFNTLDFGLNTAYTFGTAPRVMPNLYGPGIDNFDVSLFKNTKIRERYTLQFRAESFNFANRVQFANPATNITLGTFGRISSQANLPRDIQLALKLLF